MGRVGSRQRNSEAPATRDEIREKADDDRSPGAVRGTAMDTGQEVQIRGHPGECEPCRVSVIPLVMRGGRHEPSGGKTAQGVP